MGAIKKIDKKQGISTAISPLPASVAATGFAQSGGGTRFEKKSEWASSLLKNISGVIPHPGRWNIIRQDECGQYTNHQVRILQNGKTVESAVSMPPRTRTNVQDMIRTVSSCSELAVGRCSLPPEQLICHHIPIFVSITSAVP